jgi:hypothetical protein
MGREEMVGRMGRGVVGVLLCDVIFIFIFFFWYARDVVVEPSGVEWWAGGFLSVVSPCRRCRCRCTCTMNGWYALWRDGTSRSGGGDGKYGSDMGEGEKRRRVGDGRYKSGEVISAACKFFLFSILAFSFCTLAIFFISFLAFFVYMCFSGSWIFIRHRILILPKE